MEWSTSIDRTCRCGGEQASRTPSTQCPPPLLPQAWFSAGQGGGRLAAGFGVQNLAPPEAVVLQSSLVPQRMTVALDAAAPAAELGLAAEPAVPLLAAAEGAVLGGVDIALAPAVETGPAVSSPQPPHTRGP